MKKTNFFEKYTSALWCSVAALWFWVDYIFMNPKSDVILSSGIFWVLFAALEFVRCSKKSK